MIIIIISVSLLRPPNIRRGLQKSTWKLFDAGYHHTQQGQEEACLQCCPHSRNKDGVLHTRRLHYHQKWSSKRKRKNEVEKWEVFWMITGLLTSPHTKCPPAERTSPNENNQKRMKGESKGIFKENSEKWNKGWRKARNHMITGSKSRATEQHK